MGQVSLTYLTHDRTTNSFKEFLLTSDDTPDYDEEQRITIPYHLLQQANIPDVQIVCLDGALVIGLEPALNLNN